MLVLSRKKNETIIVGECIEFTVLRVEGDRVKVGVTAPQGMPIRREEVPDKYTRENKNGCM